MEIIKIFKKFCGITWDAHYQYPVLLHILQFR